MSTQTRKLGRYLLTLAVGCSGTTTDPAPSASTSTPSSSEPVPSTPVTTSEPAATTTSAPSPVTSDGSQTSSTAETSGVDGNSSEDSGMQPGYIDEGKRELLSQTGLYADVATETLAPRVKEYAPQFELWTDSAAKRRWVYIPEGTTIDTSYMDEWQFPVGTKLWKEFSRDGVRIETRLIEKLPPERAQEGFQGWLYMTYVWNEDQSDAVATTEGLQDAKGTPHDVPTQKQCGDCHDMRREKPLGFTAVQLSHSDSAVNLDTLFDEGWITQKPTTPLVVPGTEEQRQLLGYFHANCGHCHRDGSPVNNRVASLHLWLESTQLTSFEDSGAYTALVNAPTESGQGSAFAYRVVPGDPDNSELMRRLLFRAQGDTAPTVDENGERIEVPMPPLGTEVIDEPAVERVRAWIASLAAGD